MEDLRQLCARQAEELEDLRLNMNTLLDLIQEFEARAQQMMIVLGRQRRMIQRGCVLQPPEGIRYGGQTKDQGTQTD